jgi:hypothetical protein
MFVVGYDVGKSADPSAIAILDAVGPQATITAIARMALGMPYTEQVEYLLAVMQKFKRDGASAAVVVDMTGVGAPIVDLLRDRGLAPAPILITGGDRVVYEHGIYRVPKTVLITGLVIGLDETRCAYVPTMPNADLFASEMQAYRETRTTRGTVVYGEPWREGPHDDLVLAAAIAYFYVPFARHWEIARRASLAADVWSTTNYPTLFERASRELLAEERAQHPAPPPAAVVRVFDPRRR